MRLPSRTRRLRVALLCVAVVCVGASVAAAVIQMKPEVTSESTEIAISTTKIVRGALTETTTVLGQLHYEFQRDIISGSSGTVTSLPAEGETIASGQILYRIDDRPVVTLAGSLPAWRGFEAGMPAGADVQQLEAAISQLGYLDAPPDQVFGEATTRAIKALQSAIGAEPTGSLPLGGVLFIPAEIRVGEAKTAVGDLVGVGAPVVSVASTVRVVDVDVPAKYQRLAARGTAVTMTMPTGAVVDGQVAAAGTPTERLSGNTSAIVVPTTIEIPDQAALGELSLATVQVEFTLEQHGDALSVPVGALLALDGSTFAVEVTTSSGSDRIPVQVGLLAAGRAEISGPGITEGLDVIVP